MSERPDAAQQGDEGSGERGGLDTGMPPGVHPNSEEPDPEVVEESERRAQAEPDPDSAEFRERYGEATPPAGPDPVENPAPEDAATAD